MAVTEPQITAPDPLVDELQDIVGDANVLSARDELLVYECDGLPQHKHLPRAVVFPNSTEETADVLALLQTKGISFAPRGAGTGLSGGALAINRGVVIELARMRKILDIDPENRTARVQTGLVNAQLSRAVAHHGLYYVPDPSSQPSCTIGGNIAENAGGIHCLKYGTTTDHVLSVRVVLSDGSIVELDRGATGYDLVGTFVGSEGTFGIATEATVRLARIPPAIRTLLADFTDVDQASRAVSAVIAAGMLPAALEMMDNEIIRAVEASVFKAGLPLDAKAVLLVELDGIEAGLDEEAGSVETILRRHGARSVRTAADENERKKLWAARKGSFGAVGRLSPDIMIQDAVVPRSRLPEVLAETYRISAQYKIKLANVFHAGDGNLHPLICFDLRRGDDLERVRHAGREIMETCVRAGGSITGEHGVGLDKSSYLPLIFSDDDMNAMLRVREAFDPSGLCNPGKIIPLPRGCGEARAVATESVSVSPVEESAKEVLIRHANRSPLREQVAARATTRATSLADRINEAKTVNEFKRLVGGLNVTRLGDTAFANSLQSKTAERVMVLAPGSTGEISEVIKLAAAENQTIVPAGGATFLDAGNVLDQTHLILTTRRLSHLIHHEPADLVATAQAGLTLREFQDRLREKGQWLPIDPPDDGEATLGAVVATGLSGPRQTGYGPVRSVVIGLRAVLADGTAIKVGGHVVKNVAGYDLCKLFTGSYGTLGIITEVTFKLRPLPVETRTVVASGARAVLTKVGKQIAGQTSPVAVELFSPARAGQIIANLNATDYLLLVQFAGASRAVVVETAHALKLLREENIVCTTHDEDEVLWHTVSKTAAGGNNLIWRASTRPSELTSFLDDVAALEQDEVSHVGLQWQASLADGRVRGMARAPVYPRESVKALERMRQRAADLGGHLIIERAPIDIKNEVDSWGDQGSASELSTRIKNQLDPENLFSPGRFLN